MADTVDKIVVEIIVKTDKAEDQLLQFAAAMVKMQKSSKKTLDDLAIAFLKVIPKGLVDNFSKMLEAMAKGEKTFRTVEGGVLDLSKAYATLSSQEEKYNANKAKQVKDQQELNQRIKEGTASVKEYVAALKSGQAINGRTLSPQSQSIMAGIQPGVVNKSVINQVAGVMREIQSITKQSTERVAKMVREMYPHVDTKNIDLAAKKLQGFPSKIASALRDIGNVIKGTLTAMLVFNVGQAISAIFRDSLALAKKFRGEMVQLNFAESILSKKGMDITRAELDGFVESVQKTYKYISKLEAISVVSDVADIGAEFDLSKQKILGLAEAITFIQLKEKMMGQEPSDSGSIINAALDARSNYFNKLGVNITDALVKQKAYDMGLAEEGSQLTKNAKNQAAVALLIEQTANKRDELLAAIEQTNPALAEELRLQKELADAQLEFGRQLITLQDAWNAFLLSLGGLEGGVETMQLFADSLKFIAFIIASVFKIATTLIGVLASPIAATATGIGNLITMVNQLMSGDFKGAATTWAKSFGDAGRAAKEAWLRGWDLGGDPTRFLDSIGKSDENRPTDTPTDIPPGQGDTGSTDLQEALEKMREEILSAQQKLEQDLVEAEIDLQRKLQDIDTEYLSKRADAWRDYQEKVSDINRDYNDKIADINRDYNDTVSDIQQEASENAQEARNDALQKEAEFQNKLLEMRENFLMSLEDALHARDARQVLKLISQYELDKKQAERDHALDMQSDADSAKVESAKVQRELKQAKEKQQRAVEEANLDRQRKLADAELDYQQKMAQLQREETAERAAARLADQRKREDLIRGMKDRLAIIAADLVNQFNLTKAGLDAILKLFRAYYGGGGYLSQVMAGMTARLPVSAPKPTPVETGLSTSQNDSRRGRGFAEGGTMIANRPTTVTFGEGGLEMASFTPLSRTGNNVGKTFSNMSDSGNVGGRIQIELLLSPDLESRVVENSLNATAEVITRIQRSK